jgi:hypothetical protein
MSVLRKGTYANAETSYYLSAEQPLPSIDISGDLIVSGVGAFGDGVVLPNPAILSFTNASGEATNMSFPVLGGVNRNQFQINVSGQSLTTALVLQPDRRMMTVQGGVGWRSSGTNNYTRCAEGGQAVWNQVQPGGGQTEFVNARGTGSGGFSFYDGLDNATTANLSLCMFVNPTGMTVPPFVDMTASNANGSNVSSISANGTQFLAAAVCNGDNTKAVQTIMDASGKSYTIELGGDAVLQISDLGTRIPLYKPTDAGNFVWGATPTSLNLFDCATQPAGVYRAELYTAEVGSTDSYATCIFGVNGAGQCSLITLGRQPTGTWGGSGGQFLTWTTNGTYATTEALFIAQMFNPA